MRYSVTAGSDSCYEGTSELTELETVITTTKITMILSSAYEGVLDAAHYRELHQTIMGDIYDWAGCIRTVPLSKKGTGFHSPEGLEEALEKLFERLGKCGYFLDLPDEEYAQSIAEFYSDLNLLHPFREGNGRTQRVLITQLIERSGRHIDFSRCDKDMLMIATVYAAQGVSDHLTEFFRKEIYH